MDLRGVAIATREDHFNLDPSQNLMRLFFTDAFLCNHLREIRKNQPSAHNDGMDCFLPLCITLSTLVCCAASGVGGLICYGKYDKRQREKAARPHHTEGYAAKYLRRRKAGEVSFGVAHDQQQTFDRFCVAVLPREGHSRPRFTSATFPPATTRCIPRT